jgi:hypothetical protein
VVEEELGDSGAPMVLALGFFCGESKRAKGAEGEEEREVSERDGLVVTQGPVMVYECHGAATQRSKPEVGRPLLN